MAEGNKNATLCEGEEVKLNLNVTQDSLVSTNIDEHVNDTDNTTGELTIETVAVSYTHLDVYKRQIM